MRQPPGLMEVMIFHIGRAPADELGERGNIADRNYWTNQGRLQEGRRYYVDVPDNPSYHALVRLVEWYMQRQIRRDLREAG